jgi:Tfp pilus assembly protein PilF
LQNFAPQPLVKGSAASHADMRSLLIPMTVAILALSSCSDSKETRMQRFLLQGNEKIVDKEYEQAEKYFLSALRLDSCFADALNNLGTVEHRRRNNASAVNYYSRAIKCSPDFVQAYLNRANVYYETGALKDALSDIQWLEKKIGDSSSVVLLKGLVYWKMHEPSKAIGNFRLLLRRGETEEDMMINIGTLHSTMRNYDSGRYYLNAVVKNNSDNAQALNALAMLEAEAGSIERASLLIDKALQVNPDDPFVMNNKGYILLLKNQPDSALTFINESIARDPYNGWAYRNKGIHALETGNTADAVRLLKRAESIDPYIDHLFLWLGRAYLKQGDKAEACRYFESARRLEQLAEKDYAALCGQ